MPHECPLKNSSSPLGDVVLAGYCCKNPHMIVHREKIKEGKSVIITLFKNFNDIEKRTRINVKKIIPLDEIINKPINNLKIKISNPEEFEFLSKILVNQGNVEVEFEMANKDKTYRLKLKNKRFVDKNILNSIKNQGILATIY